MKTDGLFANFASSSAVSQLRKQNATFHVWTTSEHSNEVQQKFSKALQSSVSLLPQGRCTYDADYVCRFKSWDVTPCHCVSVSWHFEGTCLQSKMNADPVRGLEEILLAKLRVRNGGWGFGSWIEGGRTVRRWTWLTCWEGFRISERVAE